MTTLATKLNQANDGVKACIDAWIKVDAALTDCEAVLKHWPQTATLKKSLEKKP